MNIDDKLAEVQEAATLADIDLEECGITDNDSLILFALNYLLANLDDAFDYVIEEDYEELLDDEDI